MAKRDVKIARDPSKTEERQLTEVALDPMLTNASTCVGYMAAQHGEIDITEAMGVLSDAAKEVNGGKLDRLEATLSAQAEALNAIFTSLANRASLKIGSDLNSAERLLRLSMKAQAQCRATVEAISLIKNPPVFARQANINNGGQQQVNNGSMPADVERSARTHAGGGNSRFEQTKLLEAVDGQRMDTRTTRKARRGNQTVEAVGEVHRPGD
jgi:hypothetical protein